MSLSGSKVISKGLSFNIRGMISISYSNDRDTLTTQPFWSYQMLFLLFAGIVKSVFVELQPS